MVSLRKLMPAIALLAGSYVTGSMARAEDMDMKKVMEEIRAIKAQNAELQKQVATLKAGDSKKASAEVAVDKALKKSADDGFYHDADLHPRKIKIGGLVDFSYQYNLNNPGERFNTLRSFDQFQSNDFALNLANVYFDGTAKEKGEAGFMIDLGFGRDVANAATVNTGLSYDNVLQAYINYIAPIGKGVEMRVGKMLTPMGFEVAKGDNWNITRSMNFTWTQPLSHTGGSLSYQVLDQWQVSAMIVNSFYNRVAQDNNNSKSFMATSIWKPMKNLTWTLNGMVGDEETRQTDVLFGTSSTPVVASPYGDVAAPNYPGPAGTNLTTRGETGRTQYTINSVVTYDPWETLHFGFEFNWQMKEGFNYKKDDLITGPGGLTSATSLVPANGSLNSAIATLNAFNDASGVAAGGRQTGGLTTTQINQLYNYFNQADRGNAYTWGAAGYVKWDFQKNWYVALRGEYINDQDNLAFRNDLGVAAQNTILGTARNVYYQNLSYSATTPGLGVQQVTGGNAAAITGITPAQFANMVNKLDKRNNSAWSVTGTVGWNITKSLKWKLEYRHDEAAKDVFYKGGAHKTAYSPSLIVPGNNPAPVTSNTQYGYGYTPSTSTGQDTVSMQFQYSF